MVARWCVDPGRTRSGKQPVGTAEGWRLSEDDRGGRRDDRSGAPLDGVTQVGCASRYCYGPCVCFVYRCWMVGRIQGKAYPGGDTMSQPCSGHGADGQEGGRRAW